MPFRFHISVALLIFTVIPATTEANPSSEYSKCIEKSGGADPAILECISAQFAREDKRLNQAYKTFANLLGPERKRALQDAQRLWIKYTDANCSFYHDPDGGTSAHLAAAECGVTARAARALELEELIKFQASAP